MRTARCRGVLLLLAIPLLAGCFHPTVVGKSAPRSDRVRVESELVADARLVREKTQPNPQGRYAFAEGAHHLLVITRITSLLVDRDAADEHREDRVWERVWITLPAGMPLGAELSLKELEEQFLVGYDRRDDDVAPYIRPARVTGVVALLERDAEQALVRLVAKVDPWREEGWRVDTTMVVPVTRDGIYATPVADVHAYDHEAEQMLQPMRPPPLLPPSPLAVTPSGGTAVVADARAAMAAARAGVTGQDAIVGQWIGTTPPHLEGLYYRLHLQLDADGTFVHATGRGAGAGTGFAPGMRYGTWRLRGDYLQLDVKKFVFRDLNSLPEEGLAIVLQVAWDGGQLLLSGDFKHPIGDPGKFGPDLQIRFKRASYPDLGEYRPEPNLRDGYDPYPEPAESDILTYRRVKVAGE